MWSAARGHLAYATLQHALREIPITRAIAARVELHPDWSLIYALDILSIHGSPYIAPVVKDGETIGVFTMEALLRVPRISRGTMRVSSIMRSLNNAPSVSADSDVFHTLRKMESTRADFILVKNGTDLLGIIGRRELVSFAERHRRLLTAPGT